MAEHTISKSNHRALATFVLKIALPAAALLALAACDRAPGAPGGDAQSVSPVLVVQVRKGPFRVERRFTGEVRADVSVLVTVRERGEVAQSSLPPDGQRVEAGRVLLQLRSPELALDIEETGHALKAAQDDLTLYRDMAEKGLVPAADLREKTQAFEIARVRLERLKLRADQLAVKAPIAGTALRPAGVAAGQFLEQGTAVLTIVDPSSLVVEVAVPAETAEAPGSAVIDANDKGLLEVRSLAVTPDVDPARGGRILKLKPASPDALVLGSTVAVRIILVSRDDALCVPTEAVRLNNDGDPEVLAGPAPGTRGSVRPVLVARGPDNGEEVVIERGVAPGDWVLARARDFSWARSYLGVGK